MKQKSEEITVDFNQSEQKKTPQYKIVKIIERTFKQHQVDQYLHYNKPRRNKGIKEGKKVIFKMMAGNFPSLGKETDIQMQKTQGSEDDESEAHTTTHYN